MNNDIKCVICDSNCESLVFNFKNSVTSDNRFVKKDISYSYCKNCDYIFVNYDSRIDFEKFYKDEYDFLLDNDEIEPEIDGIKYSDYIVNFFSEFINNDKNKYLLDIGAGKGNLLQSFYNRFINLNYFAIEPSNAFFKLNEKKFIHKTHHGFFSENNFSNIKFDYITLVEVLEHIHNPKTFLKLVSKIMHKDSILLIEVPNFSNHKSDLLTIDHLSLFTENNLVNLLTSCGFSVIKKNISNRVPMQFVVKLNSNIKVVDRYVKKTVNDSLILYEQAIKYVEKVINDTNKINNKNIAIYGQNVLLDYLVGNGYLKISNIDCIINDNKHYQGKKKWRCKIDVVGFEDFKRNYNSENILLAMNDCYHSKIIDKLENKNIYGVLA